MTQPAESRAQMHQIYTQAHLQKQKPTNHLRPIFGLGTSLKKNCRRQFRAAVFTQLAWFQLSHWLCTDVQKRKEGGARKISFAAAQSKTKITLQIKQLVTPKTNVRQKLRRRLSKRPCLSKAGVLNKKPKTAFYSKVG